MITGTMATSGETAAPYHLLAKPAGATCNLGCHYCPSSQRRTSIPAKAT